MCELLGMSANVPTDICFSFTGLLCRGGKTGPHKDGWGIAFYEGKSFREFKDPLPSADSEIAKLVSQYPIKSHIVLGHIRQANSGKVSLENTHPFSRELWGRAWVYAHNGQLKGIKKKPCDFYKPIGTTDSEHAFCWMMSEIRRQMPRPPKRPETLWKLIQSLSLELSTHGVFNLLLSDSRYLYAFCGTKLSWITRKAPFGLAQLKDDDVTVNFQHETTPDDIVSVIATEPLTHNEQWTKLKPGQMIILKNGELVCTHHDSKK